MNIFLPTDDMTSASSAPHLFLDSSSSTICPSTSSSDKEPEVLLGASSPHIFLSYAKPAMDVDRKPSIVSRYTKLRSSKRNHALFRGPDNAKVQEGSSPHQPKSITPNPNTTNSNCFDESQSTQAGQETHEIRRPFHSNEVCDWADICFDFERQCRRYMIERHGLGKSGAGRVASAMGNALADMQPRGNEKYNHVCMKSKKNDYLSKYASMIDRSFRGSNPNSSHTDLTLEELHRKQEDELAFLRSALKFLILIDQPSERRDFVLPKPVPIERMNGQTFPDDIPQTEIPSFIELSHHDVDIDNNNKKQDRIEDASELTPSLDDFFLDEQSLLLQPQSLLDEIMDEEREGSFACCVQRPSNPMLQDIPLSYPDLTKGEVRGQYARSLEFSVYVNDSQALLKGRYSGKISLDTGLPHGKGVFRFDNRDVYIGDFWNGMMHGNGCLYTIRNQTLLKVQGTFQTNDFYGDGSLLEDTKGSSHVCV